jgi:hypothetical protein
MIAILHTTLSGRVDRATGFRGRKHRRHGEHRPKTRAGPQACPRPVAVRRSRPDCRPMRCARDGRRPADAHRRPVRGNVQWPQLRAARNEALPGRTHSRPRDGDRSPDVLVGRCRWRYDPTRTRRERRLGLCPRVSAYKSPTAERARRRWPRAAGGSSSPPRDRRRPTWSSRVRSAESRPSSPAAQGSASSKARRGRPPPSPRVRTSCRGPTVDGDTHDGLPGRGHNMPTIRRKGRRRVDAHPRDA